MTLLSDVRLVTFSRLISFVMIVLVCKFCSLSSVPCREIAKRGVNFKVTQCSYAIHLHLSLSFSSPILFLFIFTLSSLLIPFFTPFPVVDHLYHSSCELFSSICSHPPFFFTLASCLSTHA